MSPTVRTVEVGESVLVACARMREGRVQHLPVLRDARVVGLVDRELLSEHLTAGSWSALDAPAEAVMRREVVRVHPTSSLRDAARLLTYSPAGAVVVTEAGRLVGIITDADVVRAVAGQVRNTTFGGPAEPTESTPGEEPCAPRAS